MNLIPSLLLLTKLHKHIWLRPSCNHPKTLSFRATTDVECSGAVEIIECSGAVENIECSGAVENIVRGARSDRLFFEPDATNSILEIQGSGRQCASELGGGGGGELPYKESVAVVVESENPYGDFKKSMEEMVEIHDLRDWECLEELLGWYLRMNGKNNHGFIVGAFVDLLAGNSGGGCRHEDGGGGCGGSCTSSSLYSFF